jgi:MFS family permease
MTRMAMQYLVYRLTGSIFLLGFIGFVSMVPSSVITPIAGVWLDRWNKHTVIVITQTLAMIQSLTLALLALKGWITPGNAAWVLITLGIFQGLINAFDMPARQSFVVEMVERREDLSNAIALNSTLFNGAQLIGPMVAGLTIYIMAQGGKSGEGWCFLLDGVSYIAVIIALLVMRLAPREARPARRRVLEELREGARYAYGFFPTRALLLNSAWTSLVGMSSMTLMPVFAKGIFHGDSRTLSYLVSAGAIGAMVAAGYLASRRSVLGLERVLVAGAALFSLTLVGFAYSKALPLALMFLMVGGAGRMAQMASTNTILQTLAEDDKRGRLMSFYAWSFMGMAPWGSLLAGSMGHVLGAPMAVWLSGIGCFLAAGVLLLGLPRLQRLSGPIYQAKGIIGPIGDLTGHEQVPNPTEPEE